MSLVKRAFADIREGQLHFRTGARQDGVPLVMLNVVPGTSRGLEPVIAQLGDAHRVLAFDLPGTGDSVGPERTGDDEPPLSVFADMLFRALDGLEVDTVDLYGNRVGAHLALEMTVANPDRVRKLVVDGLFHFPWPDELPWKNDYDPPTLEKLRATYTPKLDIDLNGTQLLDAWTQVRDEFLFWPWYERKAPHSRTVGLPPADELHDKAVEVLKAAPTQHLVLRASFDQDWRSRCAEAAALGKPILADKNSRVFIPGAALKESGRFDSFTSGESKAQAVADEIKAFLSA